MKHIGNLRHAEGAKKKKKRIGRGPGSGHGGTSTQGHKGQKSRSGTTVRRGFEGGQMPMNRRLPKFGFHNPFRVEYQVVNIATLQTLVEENRISGTVDMDILYTIGAISKRRVPLKILGSGELNCALSVTADSFSNSAKEKIESAGGKVVIND